MHPNINIPPLERKTILSKPVLLKMKKEICLTTLWFWLVWMERNVRVTKGEERDLAGIKVHHQSFSYIHRWLEMVHILDLPDTSPANDFCSRASNPLGATSVTFCFNQWKDIKR